MDKDIEAVKDIIKECDPDYVSEASDGDLDAFAFQIDDYYKKPVEVKFNNALEADAHNWDVREIQPVEGLELTPPLLSDEEIKELTGHTTSYEPKDNLINYCLNEVREVAEAQRDNDVKWCEQKIAEAERDLLRTLRAKWSQDHAGGSAVMAIRLNDWVEISKEKGIQDDWWELKEGGS